MKVNVIAETRAPADSAMVARLPPVRDSVSRAIALARLFAARASLDAETAESLAILVEEWTMNIVEHGGADRASLIVLRLERLDDLVRLTVSDAGVAFDPRTVEMEMEGPNEDRGGGAGIAMIRAWSRIAGYRRRGGRNRLVLELD